MKKVLFTATVDSHILQFHIPYLKLFKDKGWEVHVATNGNEEIPYCDKKHVISFERSPYKLNNLKAIKQLKKIIDEEKFDIIHTHTPMGSVVTRLAAKEARKNGTRVIYTAHGFHFYKGAPLINWLLFYPVEKYLAKYTDTLITINQEDFERAKKKFSKRCKDIQLVHGTGFDTKKFEKNYTDEEKEKIRKSLNLNNEQIILTYVAEINKNKNQIILLDIMKKLIQEEKYRLLLVGNGKLKDKLEKKIQKEKLEKYIILLGRREDVPDILAITNIYVATSKREGLPINIIEAKYMKLPIVAIKNRGHCEIIKNRDGIVNNSKEFFIEIKKKEEEKPKRTAENREEIKSFLLDNIIQEMKNIYSIS